MLSTDWEIVGWLLLCAACCCLIAVLAQAAFIGDCDALGKFRVGDKVYLCQPQNQN
ncbi:hypothetical protein [[Haemophilus] ducreyi]|nr:hypothetical protein [[Haemophilus] ducreyi]